MEGRIERAESKLRKLEDELADPAAWSSPGRIERGTKHNEEAKTELAELYAEWEAAQAEAEGAAAGSG